MASMNTTPPVILLNGETLSSMNDKMSLSVAFCPEFSTIYARGRSSSFLFQKLCKQFAF